MYNYKRNRLSQRAWTSTERRACLLGGQNKTAAWLTNELPVGSSFGWFEHDVQNKIVDFHFFLNAGDDKFERFEASVNSTPDGLKNIRAPQKNLRLSAKQLANVLIFGHYRFMDIGAGEIFNSSSQWIKYMKDIVKRLVR